MATQPLLFTLEFRRKMAELSQHDREEWLASVAARMKDDPSPLLAQELREVARGCRLPLVESIDRQLGRFPALHLRALLEVPRERFVRPDDVLRSADDTPLPLDDDGFATISAPHAYLLSFRLIELAPGDSVVELGAGSGYGAALAAFIVGAAGRVVTFEIDPFLAEWAKRTLSDHPNVSVIHGDAMTSAPQWGRATKVVVTFAVDALPGAWLDALPEGGMLVAPVGREAAHSTVGREAAHSTVRREAAHSTVRREAAHSTVGREAAHSTDPREAAYDKDQRLVLVKRDSGGFVESEHGAVRYVKNRSTR